MNWTTKNIEKSMRYGFLYQNCLNRNVINSKKVALCSYNSIFYKRDRWTEIKTRCSIYSKFMRFDKSSAVLLVAAPALWTQMVLTEPGNFPDVLLFSKLFLGGFFVRTAECCMNDFFDRDIDKKVERTKSRMYASGNISTLEAVTLTGIFSAASLGILLSLPPSCWIYGFGGFFCMLLYPFFKRFLFYPGFHLSLINSIAIPLVYSAMGVPMNLNIIIPLVAAYTSLCTAYETIYSFQDIKGDTDLKLKSSALAVGFKYAKPAINTMLVCSLASFIWLGIESGQTYPYYVLLTGMIYTFGKTYKNFDPNVTSNHYKLFSYANQSTMFVFIGLLLSNLLK